jgi:hypothetical protein
MTFMCAFGVGNKDSNEKGKVALGTCTKFKEDRFELREANLITL